MMLITLGSESDLIAVWDCLTGGLAVHTCTERDIRLLLLSDPFVMPKAALITPVFRDLRFEAILEPCFLVFLLVLLCGLGWVDAEFAPFLLGMSWDLTTSKERGILTFQEKIVTIFSGALRNFQTSQLASFILHGLTSPSLNSLQGYSSWGSPQHTPYCSLARSVIMGPTVWKARHVFLSQLMLLLTLSLTKTMQADAYIHTYTHTHTHNCVKSTLENTRMHTHTLN